MNNLFSVSIRRDDEFHKRKFGEMKKWCEQAIDPFGGEYTINLDWKWSVIVNITHAKFYFKDEKDATMFMLKWL